MVRMDNVMLCSNGKVHRKNVYSKLYEENQGRCLICQFLEPYEAKQTERREFEQLRREVFGSRYWQKPSRDLEIVAERLVHRRPVKEISLRFDLSDSQVQNIVHRRAAALAVLFTGLRITSDAA